MRMVFAFLCLVFRIIHRFFMRHNKNGFDGIGWVRKRIFNAVPAAMVSGGIDRFSRQGYPGIERAGRGREHSVCRP